MAPSDCETVEEAIKEIKEYGFGRIEIIIHDNKVVEVRTTKVIKPEK